MLLVDIMQLTAVCRDTVAELERKYKDITFPHLGSFSVTAGENGLAELKAVVGAYMKVNDTEKMVIMSDSVSDIDTAITGLLRSREINQEIVDRYHSKQYFQVLNEETGNIDDCSSKLIHELISDNLDAFDGLVSTREAELVLSNIPTPGTDISTALNTLNVRRIPEVLHSINGNFVIFYNIFKYLATVELTNDGKNMNKLAAVYNNKDYIVAVLKLLILIFTKDKETDN